MGSCCSASGTAAEPKPRSPQRSSTGAREAASAVPTRSTAAVPERSADHQSIPSARARSERGGIETYAEAQRAALPPAPPSPPADPWGHTPGPSHDAAGGPRPPVAQLDRAAPVPVPAQPQAAVEYPIDDSDDDVFSDPEPIHQSDEEGGGEGQPACRPTSSSLSSLAEAAKMGEAEDVNAAATPWAMSANATPERPAEPALTPREGEDGTRGPSTARVEEVPPTPLGKTGTSLSIDDARVLQRAPPPPPPTESIELVESRCDDARRDIDKKRSSPSPRNIDKDEAEEGGKDAVAAAEESGEEDPNPLADILRRQQNDAQRYPTALSTDVIEDAPLEISLGDIGAPIVAANLTESAHQDDRRATRLAPAAAAVVSDDVGDDVSATPPSSSEGIVPPEPLDTLESGVVYKLLRQEEWAAFRETGETRGTPEDERDGYIRLAMAEQMPAVAQKYFATDAQLMLLACSVEELSRPASTSLFTSPLLNGPALRWEAGPGKDVWPHLYRPLRRDTDVLWRKPCADASEVAAKIHSVVVLSDSSASSREEEELHGDAADGRAPPLPVTRTDEVRRLETVPGEEDEHSDASSSLDEARVYTMRDEERDLNQPQVVHTSVVPSVALMTPTTTGGEAGSSPMPHASAAMHAAEKPSPADVREAPQRVPPPLPPPSSTTEEEEEDRLRPPSRPAPLTILSPPPFEEKSSSAQT